MSIKRKLIKGMCNRDSFISLANKNNQLKIRLETNKHDSNTWTIRMLKEVICQKNLIVHHRITSKFERLNLNLK